MSRLDEELTRLTAWARSLEDKFERLKNVGSQSRIYMTAAPTTGTWTRGAIVYNELPSAGEYVAWICVSDGTPGTWKPWGLIAS